MSASELGNAKWLEWFNHHQGSGENKSFSDLLVDIGSITDHIIEHKICTFFCLSKWKALHKTTQTLKTSLQAKYVWSDDDKLAGKKVVMNLMHIIDASSKVRTMMKLSRTNFKGLCPLKNSTAFAENNLWKIAQCTADDIRHTADIASVTAIEATIDEEVATAKVEEEVATLESKKNQLFKVDHVTNVEKEEEDMQHVVNYHSMLVEASKVENNFDEASSSSLAEMLQDLQDVAPSLAEMHQDSQLAPLIIAVIVVVSLVVVLPLLYVMGCVGALVFMILMTAGHTTL